MTHMPAPWIRLALGKPKFLAGSGPDKGELGTVGRGRDPARVGAGNHARCA